MKIQFLGTAAAEGVPALFCRCKMCSYARQAGGKEIRTRSGAIIDGKIKLDFGPDSYHHMLLHGLNYADVHSVLITHSHSDHFAPVEMDCRFPVFSDIQDDEMPMTVYGNEAVGAGVERYLNRDKKRIAFCRMVPFAPVDVEGYRVTALEAVHCTDGAGTRFPVEFMGRTYYRSEEAVFYLIEKDGTSILYAHDTCEFTPRDMDFLAGKRISLISMDCTGGTLPFNYGSWVGHMAADGCLHMKELLLENGAADAHTIFVANHFSHNGCVPYAELEKAVPGFLVSYDGMEVTVGEGA